MWPPEGAELLVAFRVVGMPRPAGSKNVIPLGRRDPRTRRFQPYTRGDGSPIFNVQDSSGQAGENWRADVRAAAFRALDEAHGLADGPLAVRVVFSYRGPAGRYGTGRNAGVLKPGADRYPHRGELADGTKLGRALEDALTAIVWTDDRRVCEMWWSRSFDEPGARVEIYALPATVGPVAEALTFADVA